MKKLAFLTVVLVYSSYSFGQIRISLSDVAKVELPVGIEKINKEDALAFASKQFNNDSIILKSTSKRRPENMYRIQDVLVSLFTDNNSVQADHLSNIKRGLDKMLKNNSTYSSNLEKINNNSVLVVNYIMGNVEYYRFFAYNANNTRSVTGILEFV